MQAIADRCPEVYLSIGLHPLDMDKWTPDLPDLIRRLAESDSRVVAIGETGLDFFKADDAELQRQAFLGTAHHCSSAWLAGNRALP